MCVCVCVYLKDYVFYNVLQRKRKKEKKQPLCKGDNSQPSLTTS